MADLPSGFSSDPPDTTLPKIITRESGGRNLPPEANYDYPRSHASGYLQFEPQTWREMTHRFGVGEEYPTAYAAPEATQKYIGYKTDQAYGPNSSYTWRASAPPGGYPEPRRPISLPKGFSAQKIKQTGMIPSGFSKTNPGIIDPEIKARQKQTPNAVSSTQDSGFLNRIGQTAKQVASRVQSNVDPDTDPAVIAHQSGMPIVNRALSLIPKETWAHMAANPQHPFWQRLGAAIVEEGRRVGSSIFNQASVFGDVARGKANINDPKTQQRIMGAALTFGLAGDAANVGAITGRKAVQDAVKAKDANPAKASEMRLSENPSVIKPHIKPKVKTPGKEEIAPAGGSEQPASVPLVKPHIKPKIIDLNKPISVGAQSTPAHEILVQNIKERELAEAKTHPELKQHLRAAANVLKAIAHPQGLRSPLTGRAYGHEAATTIRKFAGRAAAASNQSKAMLGAQMQVYKTMNNLSPQEGLQVLKWLQKPSTREVGLYHPTQGIKEFMDTFKEVMDNIATRLASLPKTSEMEFKKDFVSQIWREPVKVLGYLQSLAPKQGSGYFTKGSVFDDYEEGIRAGFIPLSTNPLEIGLRYVENANKFMHMNEILDEGTAQGNIVWRTNIEKSPEGWEKLNGRAQYYKGPHYSGYAPPEWAEVFNNYVSTLPSGLKGEVLRRMQRASNLATVVKLSLSWFHAGLMMNESIASGIANSIDNIMGGHILHGAVKLAESPIYPISSIARARNILKAYDVGATHPKFDRALIALIDANFKVRGKGNIADEYRATQLPNFFESFRKGRLRLEANQALAGIKTNPVKGISSDVVNTALRGLETAMAPIFEYAVPRLKLGAAYDMMITYMKKYPDLTDEQYTAYAQRVSDTIDDRFGEMNHDNIFLSRTQKAMLQSAFISYSYTLGSIRATAKAAFHLGKLPKEGWDHTLSYAIGLPMSLALMATIYQYLKTGKSIQSYQDVQFPQSGGTDPKYRGNARVILPSQVHSIINMFTNPVGEFGNKVNDLWKTVYDLSNNTNWRGDQIIDYSDPVIQQLSQFGQYLTQQLATPIYIGGMSQRRYTSGSTAKPITEPERFLGVREAPMRGVDPEGYQRMIKYKRAEAAVDAETHKTGRRITTNQRRKLIQQKMYSPIQ